MFEPIVLSLGTGLRQDLARAGLEMPTGLQACTNAVFTKRGSLRGRPGYQLRSTVGVQVTGAGSALTAFTTAVGTKTPAGIVGVQSPGVYGTESALASWQGLQLLQTSELAWKKVGSAVSSRLTRSAMLQPFSSGGMNPIPCGSSVVGKLVTNMGGKGLPFVNTQGEIDYLGTGSVASMDAASAANIAAAGNALFYTTTAGDVRMHLPGSLPTTTDSLIIAGDARTDATPRLNITAAAARLNPGYFIAYVALAAADRIIIKRLSAAGAVQATLTVNGLGTVYGCAIAVDASDRLVLCWIDTATNLLKSKAFTTTTSAITDAALDYTLPHLSPASTAAPRRAGFTCSCTNSGEASVTLLQDNGDLFVGGRSFTAAVGTGSFTLFGAPSSVLTWEPLFGTTRVGGRDLVGVQRTAIGVPSAAGPSPVAAQWIVLDITDMYGVGGTSVWRSVVAHGPVAGNTRVTVSNTAGVVSPTSIAFGMIEGSTFDVDGVSEAQILRVQLDMAPTAVAHGHGLALLTAGNAQTYDGRFVQAHPFPETYPSITGTVAAGGGTLAAGSYTHQVTWETLNARGQVVRSGSSTPVSTTAALNQKITVTATVPQLLTFNTDIVKVKIKLWATEVNPAAGAALYYTAETELTAGHTSASLGLEHTAAVDTTYEQLYTGGSVLDDEPPPAGDRGVAHGLERLWVAGARAVYASKLLRPNHAPAWNTEGLHTIQVPAALGEIQGLAGYTDRLFVVCSDGIAVIRGGGFDDEGNGVGWAVDTISTTGAGVSSPRRVLATPDGVAFVGRDGGVWIVDVGGEQRISGPAHETIVAGDLTFAPSRTEAETQNWNEHLGSRKLFAGTGVLVYDFDAEQWGDWTLGSVSHHSSVNGVLWFQRATAVYSVDGSPGTDDPTGTPSDVIMSVTTGHIAPAGNPAGFGRLRKIQLHGDRLGSDTVDVTVVAAGEDQTLLSGTFTWSPYPVDNLWPRGEPGEVWADIQRCKYFNVAITLNPAIGELVSVVLWVTGGGAAPNHNRF